MLSKGNNSDKSRSSVTKLELDLYYEPPAGGSTQVLLCLFPGTVWLWHFLYSVVPHPVASLNIYTLSLCRGHSWRMWLAKQETPTPPGHLVSPLVCRRPWMSTVVLSCCCRSDSASVFCILHDEVIYQISSQYLENQHRKVWKSEVWLADWRTDSEQTKSPPWQAGRGLIITIM